MLKTAGARAENLKSPWPKTETRRWLSARADEFRNTHARYYVVRYMLM